MTTESQVNNTSRQGLYKTRDLDYTCTMVTDTSGLTTQLFTDPPQVNVKQYWANATDESMPPVYRWMD